MTSGIDDARGHLHLEVGQLADLDRLVGTQLEGSLDGAVDFTPRAGHTRAKFQLDAKDLSAGRFSGTIHVAGEGDTSAVAAQLHVQSANLGGFPAELSANAAVNLDTHRVRIDQAALDYRGQRFRAVVAGARLLRRTGSRSMSSGWVRRMRFCRSRARSSRRSMRTPRCSTSIPS